jgi:lipopolysaccharide exporter
VSEPLPSSRSGSQSTLKSTAARGAGWMIVLSNAARAVGLVGTLVLTYFLSPSTIGEVSIAIVLTLTAAQLSSLGLGQYLVTHPDEDEKGVWHALVLHVVAGAVVLGGMLLLRRPLAGWTHSRAVASYLPWLAIPAVLERISFVPERLLTRALRFKRVAVIRSLAELAYSTSSVALAMAGLGGMAVVYANVARSTLRFALFTCSVKPGEWLVPTRLKWPVYARMLSFGLPLAVGVFIEYSVARWDNLLFAFLFGPTVMGEYSLAYNLADVPADQVGEQLAEVLMPSLARLDREQRRKAVVFATGIVGMVAFPLAMGFGAIAETAVHTLLPPRWWGVAPMLSLLCVLSVLDRTRVLTLLQLGKLCAMVALVLTLGRLGPLWACLAVGAAFAAHALSTMWVIARTDVIPMLAFLRRCVVPAAASAIMIGTVLGTRLALARAGIDVRGVNLVVEIASGALAYVGACLVVGPAACRELVDVVRSALERRRVGAPPVPAAS